MDGGMDGKKYQRLDTKLVFKEDGFSAEYICVLAILSRLEASFNTRLIWQYLPALELYV